MSVCVFLRISRKNLDNQGKNHDFRACYDRSTVGKATPATMGIVNFSAKTQKKRKELCRKKIIEDLADIQTVNNMMLLI